MKVIKGLDKKGVRINSMDFEYMVREAAAEKSKLSLKSYGQHNIGIRLYREDGLHLQDKGPCGQRLGSMGMPGTTIVCFG